MALPSRNRSFTLVQVELATAGTNVIYTTPADRIALVKTWTLHNTGVADLTLSIGVRPADPAVGFFWFQGVIKAGEVQLHEHWLVLESNDEIVVNMGNGTLRAAVYGTSLRS